MHKIKLLFDQNISFRIVRQLPDVFSDSRQVRIVGMENATDLEIWEYARNNDFTIVTFDADFYDISLIKGHPPKIVWLQIGNSTTAEVVECILANQLNILDFIGNSEQSCLEIQ
jgi:predicted nuclease of predicted toxin-antitoxin system